MSQPALPGEPSRPTTADASRGTGADTLRRAAPRPVV